MNTDRLMVMLATGIGAIDVTSSRRRFPYAVALATGLSVLLMAAWLGVRSTLAAGAHLPMFWFKELFCLALAAGGLFASSRLARPGASLALAPALIAATILVMWGAAAVDLLQAPAAQRSRLMMGISANECTLNVVALSIPFLLAVMWAMKGLAPTRLRQAGAIAGFASGAMGALVYSLHCPELAAPFLAIWYVLGMLIPAAVGALLGPWLLRW